MRTEDELTRALDEVERDERLHYKVASIASNSVLVVEQVALHAKASALRWALGFPARRYHGRDDETPCEGCGRLTEGRALATKGQQRCSECGVTF